MLPEDPTGYTGLPAGRTSWLPTGVTGRVRLELGAGLPVGLTSWTHLCASLLGGGDLRVGTWSFLKCPSVPGTAT